MELFPYNLIENDKLFLVEINNHLKNRVVEISDALFQSFEINSDDVYYPIHEIDPDINFYNELIFTLDQHAIIIWKMHFIYNQKEI